MATLTETIQGLLTPQLLSSFAARTGLPESKLRSGMNTTNAAIMEGLAGKAHDPRAMGQVVDLADQVPDDADPMTALDEGSTLSRLGGRLMSHVSDDQRGLVQRLSGFLGVGGGTMSTLLPVGAGLVLAGLRKFSRARGGLDAQSLASTLLAERASFVPPGKADTTTATRVAAPGATGRAPGHTVAHEHRVAHGGGTSRRWLWLALIPLVLLGLWWLNRAREPQETEPPQTVGERRAVEMPAAPQPLGPPTAEEPGTAGEPMTATEPQPPMDGTEPPAAGTEPPVAGTEPPAAGTEPPVAGTETETDTEPTEPTEPTDEQATADLDFPEGTPEAALLTEVQGAQAGDLEGAEGEWVQLDAVQFGFDSAEVPDSATPQLSSVARILEANPEARIEIGGHTDAVGDEDYNLELSRERAENTRQALIEQGADEAQIVAEGYGDQEMAEDTESAAAANRRATARVLGT